MSRFRLLLAFLAALAVLAFACNGDDDGGKESPTASVRTSTLDGDKTATPGGDDKYTPVDETPEVTETADTSTPPPPAAEGIPAIAPEDQNAYTAQFQGRDVLENACAYNPGTRVADCAQQGRFAVDPPLAGQDISCSLGVVDGQPEYIRCSSVQPQQSKWYEIRG